MTFALATASAHGWTDAVWGTNATPRGATITTNLWIERHTTNEVVGSITNSFEYWTHISTVSNRPNHAITNGVVDVKQRRIIEAMVSLGQLDDGEQLPARLYRTPQRDLISGDYEPYDGLTAVKDAFAVAVQRSINRTLVSNLVGGTVGDDLGPVSASSLIQWLRFDATSALAYAGAPTNWLAWSPTRNPHGWGRAIDSTSAVSYTISTTNAGMVTNAVVDVFGVATNIMGTNGQTIVVPPVASPILAGFNSHDYGWRMVPQILNAISWREYSGNLTVGISNQYGIAGLPAASYAVAVSDAETAYAASSPSVFSFPFRRGFTHAGGADWQAEITGLVYFEWDGQGTVGYPAGGDFYAVARAANTTASGGEYNAQGSVFAVEGNAYAAEIAVPITPGDNIESDLTAFGGGVIPPNQPPEPIAGSNTSYGYSMTFGDFAGFVIPTNYYLYIETD